MLSNQGGGAPAAPQLPYEADPGTFTGWLLHDSTATLSESEVVQSIVGALGKYASLPLAYQWVTLRRQPWSLSSGALGAWQSAVEELTSRNRSTKRKFLASTTSLPPVSLSWPFAPVLFCPPPSRLPVPKRGGQRRGGWGSQPVI
jgi:hypothetical protein